jgi:hypothetical protein
LAKRDHRCGRRGQVNAIFVTVGDIVMFPAPPLTDTAVVAESENKSAQAKTNLE